MIDGELVSTRVPRTFPSNPAGKKNAQAYANQLKQENSTVQGFDTSIIQTGMPIGSFLDTVVENANAAVQTGLMNVGVQLCVTLHYQNLKLIGRYKKKNTLNLMGLSPPTTLHYLPGKRARPVTMLVGPDKVSVLIVRLI